MCILRVDGREIEGGKDHHQDIVSQLVWVEAIKGQWILKTLGAGLECLTQGLGVRKTHHLSYFPFFLR